MILTTFIQNGLELIPEGVDTYYRHSKNLQMKFIKDENHSDYTLKTYYELSTGEIAKLETNEDGTFTLDERFFEDKKPFYLSFALIKNDEILHFGKYKVRVDDSAGNESTVLPDRKTLWVEYVDKEIEKYFSKNFQPKLDNFNTSKADFDTKYQEVLKKADEVANDKSSVDSKAKEVATNKETVQQLAKNIADQANSFNNDYLKKKTEFNGIVTDSKNEISSLKDDSKQELEEKKQEISDNLDAQYAQFDGYINQLNAMGIVVVDGCLCMHDEEEG